MHVPTTFVFLLLSPLALATTTILIPGVPPAGLQLPPSPQDPQPQDPQLQDPQLQDPQLQDPTETYEPNHLTHFVTNKLSTPRKWMLKKAPAPAPPPGSATPVIVPSTNVRPPYTDPAELQRFVKDLRASRRASPLRRRGIMSSSESMPLPASAAVEEVMPKELTKAEFDALFGAYNVKHDNAAGLARQKQRWEEERFPSFIPFVDTPPPKGQNQKWEKEKHASILPLEYASPKGRKQSWGEERFPSFIPLMDAPKRGSGRYRKWEE